MALSNFNTNPDASLMTTLVTTVSTGTDNYGLSVWIFDDTARYEAWTNTLVSNE